MEDILEHDCYRKVILSYAKKSKTPQRFLASHTGIHTSYFSRVMKSGADFSEEQLFGIGKVMGLYGWKMEYFLLLGNLARSGNHKHQVFVQNKIDHCRRENSKVIDKLKGVSKPLSEERILEYYKSPLTAKVHMLLTIPKFQHNLAMIQKRLRISSDSLESELKKLETLEIISRSKNKINIIKRSIHLDEAHPASIGNHKNWRIETLHKLNSGDIRSSDFHLSASFSCDEETKVQIKEILKKAIVEAQGKVRETNKMDDIFHIGIDLY